MCVLSPTGTRRGSCRCFNDGFPNVFVRDALDIRNRNVAFLASFHEPALIFEQISVIYAIPRLFIGSFTLVLPFFPTGTLERVRPCSARPRPAAACGACMGHVRTAHSRYPAHRARRTHPRQH